MSSEVLSGQSWSMGGARKPYCQECVRPCSMDVVGDGVNNIDGPQGIKLGQAGVWTAPLRGDHDPRYKSACWKEAISNSRGGIEPRLECSLFVL